MQMSLLPITAVTVTGRRVRRRMNARYIITGVYVNVGVIRLKADVCTRDIVTMAETPKYFSVNLPEFCTYIETT